MITTSWNVSGISHQSSVNSVQNGQFATGNSQLATLFTIEFTANRAGKLSEQLSLLDRPTAIEAYNQEGELMEVELILRDETGRVLKSLKAARKAGYNTIELEQEALINGFIYYQLSSKYGTQVKKMVKLK